MTALNTTAKDLSNQRFGRLIALHATPERHIKNVMWLCVCDCGNTYTGAATNLTTGRVKSCGCAKDAAIRKQQQPIHGLSSHPLYRRLMGMIRRCEDSNRVEYASYGAKGIQVCDEWRRDPQAFVDWAQAHGFSPELVIDRKDPAGGYSPENCHWISPEDNQCRRHS